MRKLARGYQILQTVHMQEVLQGACKGAGIQQIFVMLMVDILADAINTIKNNETVGKDTCVVADTKLVRSVLDIMKKNNYIEGYESYMQNNMPKLKVTLAKKINNLGVIRPRFSVKMGEYQKYELRYIPSKDFGILIISTPKGIMTNRDAKENGVGGRLLAYVY